MKKIFTVLNCADEQKVSFAAFMFRGEAEHWWKTTLRLERAAQRQIDWDRFVELMNKKYIPESVRDQWAIEFQGLQQNNMTVQEYEAKFTQLSRFAPHLIAEESDKAKKFQRGLRGNIRGKLVALRIRNYAELVETAFKIEKDLLEYQEIRNKKQSSVKRPRTEGGPTTDKLALNQPGRSATAKFPFRRDRANQPNKSAACPRCGNHHSGYCKLHRACFECGQPGHFKRDCPTLRNQAITERAPRGDHAARTNAS
ncbi:uncharacterized protein LOC109823340 [Asparagus officinalis]|uniref:uncharacterized protein LOC109823340 n=1 Tax=Asparagus officinalis TaxID=4686 RepID=UPI00098E48F8|nr:uncharacterized protein LOC109823340 [Asparagus officinalis]